MARIGAALLICLLLLGLASRGAQALERPWISDVFFYWYTWDYERAWGGWEGGVYNTPLVGYYDSRTYQDNLRELWMSGEWGMTDHFMDYWSPDWKADTGEPRDLIVMKAAQALADRGYNCWMSYYQDGDNFAMRDFARNVTEKRDVWNWLKHYAPFKVWPRLNGLPFQLVYSRNGMPELTAKDEGFRAFLKQRYGSIEALQRAWGEGVKSFDEVRVDFGAAGPRRADAIDYQYQLWKQDWARLNEAVRAEFPYRGVAASFDVGYGPFRDFSYGDFARVFGGPHSYGGTFALPNDQDAQRFIQSIVAKKYGTVFLDHLKNMYCDWNTGGRIPGTEYPPEPCAFDRFWVGNLMRYNEAVLHLSWNEWWEGSNLEPSEEYGKAFCEKNLLYSTIMQWCFPSIREFGKGAKVAVLLNDWAFKCGSRDVAEIYFAIQEMRRTMAPFDLLVDDLVTAEELERFDVIVAPAAGVGFGYNRQRERIGDLLKRWVESGRGRLVVSACPEFADYLGLKAARPKPTAERGPDMNLWVDVGTEGDDKFLVSGASGRENWGELPPEKFGASPTPHTVRWTPGAGRVTTLLVPASPNRDHVLRLSGDALRPSTISVRVDGAEVATIAVKEGRNEYEALIPAAAVAGARMLEIQLAYDHEIIPKDIDPQRYGQESRACNLALDWLEFSTSNVGPSREEKYEMPRRAVRFGSRFGDLNGKGVEAAWRAVAPVSAKGADVVSRYEPDNVARDLWFPARSVWYVNGRMDDVADPRAFAVLLQGRLSEPYLRLRVRGQQVVGSSLQAGGTVIVLAYNQDITTSREISVFEESRDPAERPLDWPVAEVSLLSRDGQRGGEVQWQRVTGYGGTLIRDRIGYYAVYQIVHSPVRIRHEPLTLVVGQHRTVAIRLDDYTERPVSGTLELASVIPTLGGQAVKFKVPARGSVTVKVPLRAADTVDWGLKTVALKVTVGKDVAYFWRTLRVLPPPDLRFTELIVDEAKPVLAIENKPHPWSERAVARKVTLTVGDQTVTLGDIASGARAERPFAAPKGRGVTSHEATLTYDVGGKRIEEKRTIRVAHPAASVPAPGGAVRAVQVFNPRETALENEPAFATIPDDLRADAARLYLADAEGRPLPAQIEHSRTLAFVASAPPLAARTYYLCRGDAPAAVTDLAVEAHDLGTGRGTVRITNSFFDAVLSEARGGTMTTLRSKATGADYAADTFGVAYGTWGKSDPLHPAHTAVEYIVEKRTYQRDTPAKIEVVSEGPARVVVRVAWSDAAVEVDQVYQFWAYGAGFEVFSLTLPWNWTAGDELVALDCRFARNALTKIYPGFSGMSAVFNEPNPHFGWRQAPRAPEFASLLAPPNFGEGISILPLGTRGVNRWRQGFWPEKRPEPGPCKYAQVEFAATSPGEEGAAVDAVVMFHAGNQVVARRALAERHAAPLVRVAPVEAGAAGGRAATPANWWNPEWHCRAPVVIADATTATEARVDLSGLPGPVDLDSFRLIRQGTRGAELVPVSVDLEGKQATVQWHGPNMGSGYFLYFDTQDHGKKNARPGPAPLASPRFVNGGLERGGAGWVLEGATWLAQGGHSGPGCLRFAVSPSQPLAVANNSTLAVEPNAQYRGTFWARTESGEGLLRTNFFASASYDFKQIEVRVPGDGEWHRFEVMLPTGEFPAGVAPAFRIWAIEKQQVTYVDDVSVEALTAGPPRPEARATAGPVEQIRG
jgi:hypothetical protein